MINFKKNLLTYIIGGLIFSLMMEFVVFKGTGNNENYFHFYFWGPLTNISTLPIRNYLLMIYPSGIGILFVYFFFMGGFLSVTLAIFRPRVRERKTSQSLIHDVIWSGVFFMPFIFIIAILNPPSMEKNREQELLQAVNVSAYSKVETLLQNGTDADCQAIMIPESPLCIAVRQNDRKMVHLLLKYKADPNKGYPLLLASGGHNLEIMRELIENKADINVKDSYGNNALNYCYVPKGEPLSPTAQKVKMIEYLGKQGINPNLFQSDSQDKTVLDSLMERRANTAPQIIAALKRIGAKSALEVKMEMPVEKINRRSVFVLRVDAITSTPQQHSGHWVERWQITGSVVKSLTGHIDGIKIGDHVSFYIEERDVTRNFGINSPEKIKGKTCWIALQNEYKSEYLGDIDIYQLDK